MAIIIEGVNPNTDIEKFKKHPSDRVVANTNPDGTLSVIIYKSQQTKGIKNENDEHTSIDG